MSDAIESAIGVIKTRLEDIKVANGYNTDAGGQVYLGRRYFIVDTATFPIISIFSGDESPSGSGSLGGYDLSREIILECYVDDISTPTVSMEQLIQDVQKAMELQDITLGGHVDSLDYAGIEAIEPPDDGGTISRIQIAYALGYQREYGA